MLLPTKSFGCLVLNMEILARVKFHFHTHLERHQSGKVIQTVLASGRDFQDHQISEERLLIPEYSEKMRQEIGAAREQNGYESVNILGHNYTMKC